MSSNTTTNAPRSLYLLIDIDNTLYRYDETGFGSEMHKRIREYAITKIGLSREEADPVASNYYRSYGLALHGFYKDYKINAKEYSDFVHQCSYTKLSRNAPLVEMLTKLQCTMHAATQLQGGATQGAMHHLYFFTNANRPHARKVLEPLGLKPVFTRQRAASSPTMEVHQACDDEGFDAQVEWCGFAYEDQWRLTSGDVANKPMVRAYTAVYEALAKEVEEDARVMRDEFHDNPHFTHTAEEAGHLIAHKRATLTPERVVMVDDSLMNLDAPLELGWNVVWCNQGGTGSFAGTPQAPVYEAAIAAKRMKVIHDILDLGRVVEEFSRGE